MDGSKLPREEADDGGARGFVNCASVLRIVEAIAELRRELCRGV